MKNTVITPTHCYPLYDRRYLLAFLASLCFRALPTFLVNRIMIVMLYHAAYAYALYTTSHVYVAPFAPYSQHPTSRTFMGVLCFSLTSDGGCSCLGQFDEMGCSVAVLILTREITSSMYQRDGV